MGYRFDFQSFIAQHKDPEDRSRAFTFGDYAFRGDIKVLRTLDALPPVRLVVAGTMQLWGAWGRAAVLKDAARASEREATRVNTIAREVARRLHMAPTPVYVTHHLKEVPAQALGDHSESFVALYTEAVRTLTDGELSFELGRQLGHVQNGHTVYQTAAFYADEIAGVVVRWAVKPATLALNHWRQRAAITADRAGLLACVDLELAERRIIQLAVAERRADEDVDVEAFTKALEGAEDRGPLRERLFQKVPSAGLRIRALRLFERSRFYQQQIGNAGADGATLTEVDDAVAAMLLGKAGTPVQGSE